MKSAPTILLVLGMHRSGTSTFARSTRVLGADLGDRLMKPREDNPRGFFEDSDLGRLQESMLKALGVAWDRLTPLTPEETTKLEELGFAERADAFLRGKTEAGGVHAFKFPPMAKFHPFWSRVLARGGFNVRRLLAIRHPLSVAHSLSRRDGLDTEYACLLLLAHVLPVLPGLCAGCSVVSDYDRLLENPEREIRRVGRHLRLEVSADALDEFRGQFLSRELRHSSYSLSDLEDRIDLDPLVSDVYAGLMDFATDRRSLADEETPGIFSRWAEAYDAKVPLLGLIERLAAERNRLAVLRRGAEDELSWRDASLSWRLTKPLRAVRTMVARSR